MKPKHRLTRAAVALCLLGLFMLPSSASASGVTVTIDAPDEVDPGSGFIARVNISDVVNFDACGYVVVFAPSVLSLDPTIGVGVTSGVINGTEIPVVAIHEREPGQIKIVGNVPGFPGVTGSGYLAELHFTVIGSDGDSSDISLGEGCLSDNTATPIPATWTGDSVHVFRVPPSLHVGGLPEYYLLVDLWGQRFRTETTSAGRVRIDLEAVSDDKVVTLRIAKGVFALTEDGRRLREIQVWETVGPPPLPESGHVIGIAYDFNPDGATFDPAIELEIRYDPSEIPNSIDEEDFIIAYYDEKAAKWVALDSVVDIEADTISTEVSHFTTFAVLAYEVAVPPVLPDTFECSSLNISPAEVDVGAEVTISVLVANTGGESGSYRVTLKIDGVVEATKEVTISPGASERVTFITSRDVVDSYSVDVNGLTGSFTVKGKLVPPVVSTVPPVVSTVPPVSPKATNWPLISGIIGGGIAVGLLLYFLVVRRRVAMGKQHIQ